ncbi:MAG: hypothetical protein A2W90_18705 [Bacteroidetes bacterium GWF2_42_66]|nr:MAG: hypothetical protein A2W90_18705 [Bacteroidetes bacterium GWF2_42_66]
MAIKKNLSFFTKSLFLLITIVLISSYKQGNGLNITPDELCKKMISNPALKGSSTGESFCWQARVDMDQFIEYYRLTENPEWLDAGIKYYDFLLEKRATDPDGYKGWIGPYGYDKNYWQDALVGDAILFSGILDFSILVWENNELKKQYGEKALSYVVTAQKDMVEKWDKRGCWYVDGPFGGYIGYSKFLKSDNLKEWVESPEVSRAGVSHPFNKQMDVAEACLKIHRITGEKKYWEIAERIYYTVKSRFQYFDGHYCWNYWEPLYPGDVDFENNRTHHWVGVHMWRSGYQAGEVGKIVNAFHYGIVFDEQDIKRMINTNLNVMWNKDRENPEFINSNGLGAEHDTTGLAGFKATYGHSNAFRDQGQLWTGLLDFDQTIRDLYELRFKNNKNSDRYQIYKKEVLVNPPCFKRKYAKSDVPVPVINYTESADLYLAAVLPYTIPLNGQSIIICNSWNAGELAIDLYTNAGAKVCSLYHGKIGKGLFMIKWDGKDPVKKKKYNGDYKIRWTINNGCREFPVNI